MDIAQLLHIRYDSIVQSEPSNIFSKFDQARITLNLLKDENNYFAVAEVGYGKTTGIIKLANLLQVKILLILPLKANVIEFEEYCNINNIPVGVLRSLDKGASRKQRIKRDKEIQELLNNCDVNIYLSVYDNLHLFTKAENHIVAQYNLIVDEAHNIVTSYRYRTKAIENILKGIPNFRKTVLISGTPEGTIDNNSNFTKIQFSSTNESFARRKLKELKIVKYGTEKLKKLLHHIISNNYSGKVVILINNRREIEQFTQMLKGQLSNDNAEKVHILSSDYKHDELFLEIAKSKYLPARVKFLITTSVLAEGLNILNEDIESIYLVEVDDWWLKRQFIGRFRLGVEIIYDFMSYIYEYPQKWIEPEIARKDLLKCAEKIVEAKNEINKLGFSKLLTGVDSQIILLDKENNIEKWDNGVYKINHRMIDINVIEKLNRIMALDPERAKEYYCCVAGYNNVNIIEYDKEIVNNHFKESKYKIPNSINDIEIVDNFINLLNAHIYFYKPTIYASKTFDRSVIENSTNPVVFKSRYNTLIDSSLILKKLFDYLMVLFSEDVPIGYLKYLFTLKLEKPNVNLKYEVRKFNNLLIRDVGKMDNEVRRLFQKNRKFNILWDLNSELENKDYIEANELQRIYSSICQKYDYNSFRLQEAYDIINSIYCSGKLQCRYVNNTSAKDQKKYFYVKPIGKPKTYLDSYSINKYDHSRYEFKLQAFINEALENLKSNLNFTN